MIIRFLFIFLCSLPLWAELPSWYSQNAQKQVSLNVDLFLSTTCPHCQKADAFFKEIEPQTPWIHVERHFINENKDDLALFNQFLTRQNINDFSVPAVFFCDSRWIGFASAETTGKSLLKGLKYCKQQIEQKGLLSKEAIEVINRWATANFFNNSVSAQPTILQYLMSVVFLDMLTPCSLFYILSFLAFLFIASSKKSQWLGGGVFILALLAVHLFQPMYTSLFYQLLPWYQIIAVLVGLSSLYLIFLYYKKRMIKPYLVLIWIFCFGVTVDVYQQNCLINWAYVFQQWLNNQQLIRGQKIALEAVYQLVYIAPYIALLILYPLLEQLKRFKQYKSVYECIGLVFVLITTLLILVRPSLLSSPLISYIALFLAIIGGIGLNFYRNRRA